MIFFQVHGKLLGFIAVLDFDFAVQCILDISREPVWSAQSPECEEAYFCDPSIWEV